MGGSGSARERRRRRQMVVGGIAALAVLLLGGVGFVWLYRALGDLGASANVDVCRRSDVRLVRAAGDGDLDTVRRELADGADPSRADRSSNTPLGCAIPRGRDDVVAVLLDAGADPNVDSGDGLFLEVPLGLALRRGDLAATQALAAHGADPDRHDCKGTPFAEALKRDDVGFLMALLPNQPNLNGDGERVPPLVSVVSEGRLPHAKALLDAGADPNGRVDGRPIIEAASDGNLELVDLLLARGASLSSEVDPSDLAGSPSRAKTGDAALVVAAGNGHAAVTGRLLDLGADPNAVLSSSALLRSILYGHHEVTDLLLSRGADPNRGRADAFTLAVVNAGLTGPSDSSSASSGMRWRVSDLLGAGQSSGTGPGTVVLPGSSGRSPTTSADDPRLAACTPTGLASGTVPPSSSSSSWATPTWLTEFDVTPLAVSLLTGSQRDLVTLLEHGADPNRLSLEHLTPLYLAGISCNVDAARALLTHGADPLAGPIDARLTSPVTYPPEPGSRAPFPIAGSVPPSVRVCPEVLALTAP